MKAKELKQLMLDMIYQGHSRQEIYDHFRAQFPNRAKDIADILAGMPTLDQRNKMAIPRIVLLVLLVVSISAKMLSGFTAIPSKGYMPFVFACLLTAISVFLVFKIVQWEPKAFRGLGLIHVFSLFRMSMVARQVNFDFNWMVGSGIAVLVIGLSFFIGSQIACKTKVAHKQVKKPDGQIVTEMTHTLS